MSCDCPFCEKAYQDAVDDFTNDYSQVNLMETRDRLSNIKDLIAVIIEALENSQRKDIKELVMNVLYFQVLGQIEQIDKELLSVWMKSE